MLSFVILAFAEITPTVIGASYADRLAIGSAYVLRPILTACDPIISFVNMFVAGLLRV